MEERGSTMTDGGKSENCITNLFYELWECQYHNIVNKKMRRNPAHTWHERWVLKSLPATSELLRNDGLEKNCCTGRAPMTTTDDTPVLIQTPRHSNVDTTGNVIFLTRWRPRKEPMAIHTTMITVERTASAGRRHEAVKRRWMQRNAVPAPPDIQHSVIVPSEWLRHVRGTACQHLSGMHCRWLHFVAIWRLLFRLSFDND